MVTLYPLCCDEARSDWARCSEPLVMLLRRYAACMPTRQGDHTGQSWSIAPLDKQVVIRYAYHYLLTASAHARGRRMLGTLLGSSPHYP